LFLFWKDKGIEYNAKLVRRWENEHRKLEKYAGIVMEAYDKGDIKKAKKVLNKLELLALNHLMDEDVTFYDMSKKAKATDTKVLAAMKEFRHSFFDTKKVLFHFFFYYTDPKTELDDTFRTKFDGIVDALVKRIAFEESNLYTMIAK